MGSTWLKIEGLIEIKRRNKFLFPSLGAYLAVSAY